MDTKKILSWIALLGGEAIIIAAFILFRGGLANNILILNIVVSSLIYELFFIDILIPWIDLSDKSQKKIGSLGVRWFFTWLYAIAAVSVMLVGNLSFEWSFSVQIISHCILLFFLVLGFVASITSSDKVKEVYSQETFNRNGILDMKKAVKNLKDKANILSDLPIIFINRINLLDDDLRFISPSNSNEAYELERTFIDTIDEITSEISNYTMNEEAIETNLKIVERVFQNRKNIYSH